MRSGKARRCGIGDVLVGSVWLGLCPPSTTPTQRFAWPISVHLPASPVQICWLCVATLGVILLYKKRSSSLFLFYFSITCICLLGIALLLVWEYIRLVNAERNKEAFGCSSTLVCVK